MFKFSLRAWMIELNFQPIPIQLKQQKNLSRGSAAVTLPSTPNIRKATCLLPVSTVSCCKLHTCHPCHPTYIVPISSLASEVLIRCCFCWASVPPTNLPALSNSHSRLFFRAVNGDWMLSLPLHLVLKGDFLQSDKWHTCGTFQVSLWG